MKPPHPKKFFLSMGVEQPCSGCSTPCHYVGGGVSVPFLGGGLIYKLLLGAKNATKTAKSFLLPPKKRTRLGLALAVLLNA